MSSPPAPGVFSTPLPQDPHFSSFLSALLPGPRAALNCGNSGLQMGWKSLPGRGHSQGNGPEMRMSVAGSGIVRRRRRPLRPEPSGPGVPVASSQPARECSFLSEDTGGHERLCYFNLY